MSTAKVRLKKAAVMIKSKISTVSPKMKNPKIRLMPMKPAILAVPEIDFVERQKMNKGTR